MFAPPARLPVPVPSGLLVKGKQTSIPLKDSSVKATIHGYLVGIDAALKYSNETSDPLEVVFRFPVEESFAVVGMEAVIAGRRIKATIREKEEARQMYDDAIAGGFSAALAEEKSGDIFSISLGNLSPNEEAELHLKLAGELPIDAEGDVRFTLPSVLKPRYTPAGSTDPLAKVGGDTSQVQQASAPAVFNFSLDVAEAGGVANVTSPTHTISSETRDSHVHVSLSEQGPLDKDLVILVHYNDPHEPKAVVEAGDGEATADSFMGAPAVMLNFFPKFTTKRASCEFIFVVDRSGSMGGLFINSARETLALFLKSIPPGCSFNIIGFGSSYQSLFPKSVPYNQDTLDKAVRHVEGIGADLGGTELLGPLQYIYKQPLLPGLPRQVFVLTDGSVSNTHSCIEEVKKNVQHARCFTFGIGSGASTVLVRGLARAGNGTAEFIQSGERFQPKVISSLKRALQPSITDLQIDFKVPGGYEVMIAPSKLPTIFNGDKAVIYGIFKSNKSYQSALSGTATLCQTKGDLKHTIPFEIPAPSKDQGTLSMPIVHHLAAKSLIKDWQAGEGLKELPETRRKEAIIKLSIESSVVSAHTAYIAVDEEQDKPIEGAIKTWDVTAMMAYRESYHSGFRFGGGGRGGGLFGASGPQQQLPNPFGTANTGDGGVESDSARSGFGAPSGSLFGRPPQQRRPLNTATFGNTGDGSTGSGFHFGQQQQQSNLFGSSSFGNTAGAVSGSTGTGQGSGGFGAPFGSLFGGPPLQQPNLFGSSSFGNTGGAVGSAGTGQGSDGFGAPQRSSSFGLGGGGFLFGAQQQQPNFFGSSSFGNTGGAVGSAGTGQGSDGFGAPQRSSSFGLGGGGFLFGAQQQQPNFFGSSSFGNTGGAVGSAGTGQGSDGFGAPQRSSSFGLGGGGFLFGAQQQQPNFFGSSSFGNTGGAVGSAGTGQGSDGFGAPQSSSSFGLGGGGFGAPSGSLFGGPPLQQSNLFGSSSSGNTESTVLGSTGTGQASDGSSGFVFGGQQQQQQSLFGDAVLGSAQLIQSGAGFGGSASFGLGSGDSLFGASTTQQQQGTFSVGNTDLLTPPMNANPQAGELSALISLQQAEGNWKLDAALASVLSKSLQHLEGACPVDCKGDIRTVWATVLALVFLEAKHSAKHDEWELVAMKAEFWLQGQTFPAGTDLDSFMEAAKSCLE